MHVDLLTVDVFELHVRAKYTELWLTPTANYTDGTILNDKGDVYALTR